MKKYKRLQEYANKSMEQYNSPEIFEELKQYIKPKEVWYEKFSRKTWYAIGGSFATIAVVVVVLLCVFLIEPGVLSTNDLNPTPNVSDNPTPSVVPPKKEYFGYNKETDSSIMEVNQHMQNLELSYDNVVHVKKHSDSQYGDVLYFSMSYYNEETLDSLIINVVTNQDYEYKFNDSTHWRKTSYKGYDLLYNEAYKEDEGIYFFKVDAILETDKEDVAICYEGVSLEETSNFLSALDQVFIQ